VTSLAHILTQYGQQYLIQFQHQMLPSHIKAIRDIITCRTPHLGGHKWLCKKCNKIHYSYHSCKNRHCPQCQNERATEWLEKQTRQLLPVTYFMATFTLPKELRSITRSHQKIIYDLFFKTSAHSLMKLAKDPRFIGGNIGMIGMLQTWTQILAYHPHIHYIIPGIALSENNKSLRYPKNDFLMHAEPLAIIFRAKLRDALKQTSLFNQIPASVWEKEWVVDIKAVGNGSSALKYLAPYLFRGAISNNNILSCHNGEVTFRYKDRATKIYQTVTLPVMEFIRRFLQHTLPKGFQKIRYYGFLATQKKPQLQKIFSLLNLKLPKKKEAKQKNFTFYCPTCKSEMELIKRSNRLRGPPIEKLLHLPTWRNIA